jgi:hypothetical protein
MIWIIAGVFGVAVLYGAWQRHERAKRLKAGQPPGPK